MTGSWCGPRSSGPSRAGPGRTFAFRNVTGNVLWRYEFRAVDGGTRLVEQRDTSRIYRKFVGATYRLMGGWDNRTRTVLAGMQETVERVKAAAEAAGRSAINP